jgi:hypothetical protein
MRTRRRFSGTQCERRCGDLVQKLWSKMYEPARLTNATCANLCDSLKSKSSRSCAQVLYMTSKATLAPLAFQRSLVSIVERTIRGD